MNRAIWNLGGISIIAVVITSIAGLSNATAAKPFFASPHVRPIAIADDLVLVVNTPADTVDVFNRKTRRLVKRIAVGVDPITIVVRPDGDEAWIANHVSDSISVVDLRNGTPTYLNTIATVQQFDRESRSTRFDEPVGIAFASNDKAYVALSSENTIAVVDVDRREVTKRLKINAQDPRAIAVVGDRLYVIPFESNNQTQLSGGSGHEIDGDLVTFDAWQHSIFHNNVLSLGHVVDIVKHPDVPDRDLFVFDTGTDELVQTVDTLGTLLYGLDVDASGNVFIAMTDARNEINGRSGTKKHGLKELGNRAFLNRVTRIGADLGSESIQFFDLEPLPPQHPEPEAALATPYAIKVSRDQKTLFVSAAASDRLIAMDASSGEVLDQVDVQAVPRGIAIDHDNAGQPQTAWVLNSVENSISVVDVSDVSRMRVIEHLSMEDPTNSVLKRGRKAFESAEVSTTKTFSCASCHPNGHTDQLLWVLKTPIVSGGDQIMPRSTMPVRGLRDTEPFHWDGVPGDPYGGNNSASVHASVPPNSDVDDPLSSIRHLVDGGIANTMSMDDGSVHHNPTQNDEGKAGTLDAADRDAMSAFLLSIRYPPAPRRPYDNVVSDQAKRGFELFHVLGDDDPTKSRPNVCGDCHRMPFLVSTNTPGTGMDAPTWRGAQDRFLILPQGRLNIIDFDFYAAIAVGGQDERSIWQLSWAGRERFNPIWDMVLEGSTGMSGAYGRQWTMNQSNVNDDQGRALLNALEQAASEEAITLRVEGTVIEGDVSTPIELVLQGEAKRTRYEDVNDLDAHYSRAELEDAAAAGRLILTWTATLPSTESFEAQPAIWTRGPIEQQRGRQQFPILHPASPEMLISGRHFGSDATVFVDGRAADAKVDIVGEDVLIGFGKLPSIGMHLMQIKAAHPDFSNDFIFYVAADAADADRLRMEQDRPHLDLQNQLAEAIGRGNLRRVRGLVSRGAATDAVDRESGSYALATAALYGHAEIAEYLIEAGADVDAKNRDGNTALHIASFLCHKEVVAVLLKRNASRAIRSAHGERAVDTVAGPWSDGLARLYQFIATSTSQDIDLEAVRNQRPQMAAMLQ
ncbi:Ankyrin repeats (3 copies) [Stieleria neptunia]|uniref:Ankyrin repeats (3 copies) n=1 Tax=Stieleria neptunia TaxID=2527979 RepID=A0A518HUS2_9BACT|nr:ankyrin repeat domain-containing protein [Stieleria neptunia]QDV44569.1 Ankyrin repeats (3 copies) [Stieleria neptunia]